MEGNVDRRHPMILSQTVNRLRDISSPPALVSPPMPENPPDEEPDSQYHSLREQLEGLLTEGSQFGRRAAEWEKVETYWHMGDALLRFLGRNGGTTHGDQTIHNLSKYLQLGVVTLYDILRFRRRISTLHARVNLGWSHYRALLGMSPEKVRYYEEMADAQAWTTRQLKQAIEAGEGAEALTSEGPVASPLRPYFGEPYTYRVVVDEFRPSGPPAIDFGFHSVWAPGDQLAGFGEAEVGQSVVVDSARATATLRTDKPRLWTYVASVRRIIDGDTIDVVVELGRGYRAFPRLRLRGIDTPELYTEAGRHAKAFVEEALSDVGFIVITTKRTDTYGRYLADVKYLAGATDPKQVVAKGVFLNRQLLDEGLATRYVG